MALFAISDLHLSFFKDKKMDKFGEVWVDHHLKLKKNWLNSITPADTVLIPGDISWAMRLNEAEPDLAFIDALPGKKVIHSGNHDFWWNSTSRLNEMYETIFFMKNNYYAYGEFALCGTRGWTSPNDTSYTAHDEKIYNRELARMELSLNAAVKDGWEKIILSIHYPPTNDKREISGFVSLIERYNVEKVIYGHLHGKNSFDASLKGVFNGVEYIFVSADYLNFNPKKILF